MTWDPKQYEKFQNQRSAPFYDLLRLISVRDGLSVIDLGCGTGELTRDLATKLPNSTVLGVDSSASMLEKSHKFEGSSLRFEQAQLEDVEGHWDVVFSNAAIQWVENHKRLIPQLVNLVKPGGQLVVQLPSNHLHASHRFITELAHQEPYRTALNQWERISPVLTIEAYARLLFETGMEEINVFEKIYPHVLENSDAIAEWTSGTALVPYFERLTPDLKDAFMAEYRSKLKHRFPESPVFYPFRRILYSATRPT